MLTWPQALLTPETERWRRTARMATPGVSTGGTTRGSLLDGGGLWTCEMTGIEIWTTNQVHMAEALELQLEPTVTPIIVPRFCQHLAPIPEGGATSPTSTHSDGTSHSDGSLYVGQGIIAVVAENAVLRATTLRIAFTLAAPLMGGEPFSIVHPTMGKRLYGVHSVGATEGGVTTVTIRPPLREAVTEGEDVDFRDPGCVMTLQNEDWLSAVDASHEMTAVPRFAEYFGA